MDSAARSFLALTALSLALAAEAICVLAVYVVLPFLGGFSSVSTAGSLAILMLVGLLGRATWRGASALRRGVTASRMLADRVGSLAVPCTPALVASAESAGLVGRVDLLEDEAGFSFVYGLASPRVAISRGLFERLGEAELGAALEHESYHVRNRDPLRALIAAVLVDAFFLLPSLAVLQGRYEAGRELAADRSAEERCGRRPLIGAMLKALEAPQWSDVLSAAPLGDDDLLTMRLARIETGRTPRAASGALASFAWSILGALVLATVFATAIIGVGGSAALTDAIGSQLSPSGAAFDALCVTPALAALALSYLAAALGGRVSKWHGASA